MSPSSDLIVGLIVRREKETQEYQVYDTQKGVLYSTTKTNDWRDNNAHWSSTPPILTVCSWKIDTPVPPEGWRWSEAELHKHQSIFEMEWMSGNAELTVWSGSRQRLVSTTSAAPSQARPPSDAALKKPGKRRNRHIWKTSNRCFRKDNIDCFLYYLLFFLIERCLLSQYLLTLINTA